MRKSNMMFTYRYNADMAHKLENNYNFMKKQTSDRRNTWLYRGYRSSGGTWGMARGEFIFPPSNKPSTRILFINHPGPHDVWMFHPGWIGKLRPIVVPDETIPVTFEDMFKANTGNTEGGDRLLFTSGIRGGNLNIITNPMAFIDIGFDVNNATKAFKSMDSQDKYGSNGERRHLYDGLHK